MGKTGLLRSVSIRKEDQVTVLAGRDKGKQGRVLKVMLNDGRALVEGVNKVKRHTRANPSKNVKGGIVEREAGIDVSNLMLVCPECSKPTRVARSVGADGKKVRNCKKCKASVDRKPSA